MSESNEGFEFAFREGSKNSNRSTETTLRPDIALVATIRSWIPAFSGMSGKKYWFRSSTEVELKAMGDGIGAIDRVMGVSIQDVFFRRYAEVMEWIGESKKPTFAFMRQNLPEASSNTPVKAKSLYLGAAECNPSRSLRLLRVEIPGGSWCETPSMR